MTRNLSVCEEKKANSYTNNYKILKNLFTNREGNDNISIQRKMKKAKSKPSNVKFEFENKVY